MPAYHPINEELARTAKMMYSFDDYVPGSATAAYRAAVDEAAAMAEAHKKKVSPFYHEKIDGLLESYSRRLATWYNDNNRNTASCPSVMISGASNFPVRKKQKQNARSDKLYQEYQEIAAILDMIKATGTGPVDLTDPNARAILTGDLEKYQKALEERKEINAYYRKHKTFVDCPGIDPDEAKRITEEFAKTRASCPWVEKPFPDYELTSIRGKIKRIQSRLDELDKLEAAAESPADSLEFDGGAIVRNAELNRLQILFDAIPSPELRQELKSYGFRWSPANKAWQRQLTQNALYDAKKILHIED